MINAIISTKTDSAVVDLPMNRYDLLTQIAQIGIKVQDQDIKISDEEDNAIRVKLYSESECGQHLVPLFNENHTLYDLNDALKTLENLHPVIQEGLEENIVNDQYLELKDIYEDIDKIIEANTEAKLSFYFPAVANVYDGDGDEYFLDSEDIACYEEEINEALQREQSSDVGNMAQYFYEEGAKDKLLSAVWRVETINKKLYGVVDLCLTESLTPEETEKLRDWISSQNSDGLGEGFEQRPVKTDEKDLYVSMWNGGDDYFVKTEDEMEEYLSQSNGQQIGGM